MSPTDKRRQADIEAELQEYPEFELTCLFDDAGDPDEVTILPDENPDRTTTWLTIDVDHAVALDEIV